MAVSENGWLANDPILMSRRTVPGTTVGLTVRKGAVGDLLLEVAARFDQEVQDIDNARGALDDWGYAERPIRGGTKLSNHASGTAIDLNATKWPLGRPASINLTPEQITTVRRIVHACRGAVRWGGDYVERKDPMHFEIAPSTTPTDCARALVNLRRTVTKPAQLGRPVLRRGSKGAAVALIQRFLGITDTGDFDETTENAVKRYQRIRGLEADGVVGPITWANTGL